MIRFRGRHAVWLNNGMMLDIIFKGEGKRKVA